MAPKFLRKESLKTDFKGHSGVNYMGQRHLDREGKATGRVRLLSVRTWEESRFGEFTYLLLPRQKEKEGEDKKQDEAMGF